MPENDYLGVMPPPKQYEAVAHFHVKGEHDEFIRAHAEQQQPPAPISPIYRMCFERGFKAWQRELARAEAARRRG